MRKNEKIEASIAAKAGLCPEWAAAYATLRLAEETGASLAAISTVLHEIEQRLATISPAR